MQSNVDDWRSADVDALLGALLDLETPDEAASFLRDLCTLGEIRDLAQRWAVARLLDAGLHYSEVSRRTGASTATITRIASWLNHGEGGYRLLLARATRISGTETDVRQDSIRLPYPEADEHRGTDARPSGGRR